ncbi:MAG TPA: RecQ family ATP-dependent DNA helicase [Symbiobacteriaceae bacterium]|nr:RecQ family ATP-dependent DNA helicase [Symbiobacteriaceae bacterium]
MLNLEAKLQEHFGFSQFRPMQKEIITEIMAGHSVAGILPTGAGKSLCYQLPALLLPGVTIVISPLISLMKDQTDGLIERGIPALNLTSHDTAAEGRAKLDAFASGQVKILFVAPERLNNPAFLAACLHVQVSLLAVDEAHCVSQWGHDFRPEYQQIGAFRAAIKNPPLLALTATARPQVQQDVMTQLGIAEAKLIKASADRPNLWLGLEACSTEAERLAVIAHLISQESESTIVYVTSRKEAESLSGALTETLGEPVGCYHAGMAAEERTTVQNQFMTDLVRVVVATNAFGMGIDKPDIRLVVHAGVPDSLEAYFQEIGRAGRDGKPARCIMVLLPGRDVKMREFLVRQSGDVTAFDRFKRVRHYIYMEEGCRRSVLLRYFGEQVEPKAEACCSQCHPLVIANRDALAQAKSARKKKGARSTGATAVSPASSGGHVPAEQAAQLYAHLKEWRRAQAQAKGVPAYVIFGDRDLAGIAEVAPRDLNQLAACKGIGPAKLQQYGEELLTQIAQFQPDAVEPPKENRAQMMARAATLVAAGETVAGVATALERAEGTVWQYIQDWVAADESGAWKAVVLQVLPRDGYREIIALLRQQEDGRLKPVFDQLGGRYSFEQIRLARLVQAKADAVTTSPQA